MMPGSTSDKYVKGQYWWFCMLIITGAAEAYISYILVPNIDQTPKTLDPTLPIILLV